MKMNLFWGAILILLGISVILPINIPIFRIALAIFFIYLGVTMLFPGKTHIGLGKIETEENTVVFGKKDFEFDGEFKEYNVVFSGSEIRLNKLEAGENVKINVVFGSADIYLDTDIPVIIEADTAFAGVKFPNDNVAALGKGKYKSKNFDSKSDVDPITIKISAVFSGVKIRE
ncbi:MAG: hypothetical protein ACQERZ_02500 [Fusobacteriota bacterium]